MPFYIVQSSFGFCGDETIDIIEAETESLACDSTYEQMTQQLEVCSMNEFKTEEEADDFMGEEGYK